MKILYVGLLYNYGKSEEGFSYEHMNVEAGLRQYCGNLGHTMGVWYPDASEQGNQVDSFLWPKVRDHQYDAIFHVAFNESLDLPERTALEALSQDIPVIQFDCDSSWRFQSWILPRKKRVSHFVTTHSATVSCYEQLNMKVIRSQWAGSPEYKTSGLPQIYDISFIGQKHGRMPDGRFFRSEIINEMIAAGLNIDLFGNYWNGYDRWHGYISDFQAVIQAFEQSKICLNLSNPWHFGTMPQIKGRHFEIPQIGRLQICTPADDLSSYFEPDKEIVIVNSVADLIDKCKYYLAHDEEREMIAAAGHARMLKDHQWSNRFGHIFKEVGL